MDTSRPAMLLSQLSRYFNHAVWGFPIDPDHILAEFKRNLSPDLAQHDRLRHFQIHLSSIHLGAGWAVHWHLELTHDQCPICALRAANRSTSWQSSNVRVVMTSSYRLIR
ncbi:hypothetical protein BYT27DRAFT_7179535 [Phlegmacium glaucopus]|nr:hypothetical protein BYT27DRAFT_7179535 [Phlegmacium glaucopus]